MIKSDNSKMERKFNDYRKTITILVEIVLITTLISLTVVNVKIVNEAKEIEAKNKVARYTYDNNNTINKKIYSAPLVTERLNAESVNVIDGAYIAYFENTYFGTLEIAFPEKIKTAVKLNVTLSEAVNDKGKPWTRANMNTSLYGFGIAFYTTEVEIPKGTETYQLELPERPLPVSEAIQDDWKGGVIPFCCCSISGYHEGILSESNIYQIAVHKVFDDNASEFISDNEILNEVYKFCKDTIKATTYAGVYIDGYRELAPYEADAYINELGDFSVSSNYDIARATLEFLSSHHTWPTEWILQTVSLAHEYYMYTADIEMIQNIYPELKKCLLSDILNEDGLLDSLLVDETMRNSFGVSGINDIIDWPGAERDNFTTIVVQKASIADKVKSVKYRYMAFIADIAGCHYASCIYKITGEAIGDITVIASPNAVVNAFYYKSLCELSFLAEEIGETEDAEYYRIKAEEFKFLYQRIFVSNKTGLIVDAVGSSHSSIHSNMFALDFGLVPFENKGRVVDYIKSKGMECSVYGSQFLLESLIKENENIYAIDLLTSTKKKSWYNMIHHTGSKLTTEAWDESIKINMDWNHAWGTAPINIITRYIVGVKPYAPGCETVIIEPHFGNLTSIDATVPINNGKVSLLYSSTGNKNHVIIETTAKAIFVVPIDADYSSLVIDGVNFYPDEDQCIWLEQGAHEISYHFRGGNE